MGNTQRVQIYAKLCNSASVNDVIFAAGRG